MIWGQRKLRKKFEDHCLEKEFKGNYPGEKKLKLVKVKKLVKVNWPHLQGRVSI